jgi:membrane-associated phospholipid phosphatase
MLEVRRKQMNTAIKLSILFFATYLLITQQVLANGWLRRLDEWIYERDTLLVSPDQTPLYIILIDDLGLRSVTAIVLLITAGLISRRYKSWRPLNLSLLSLLVLNLFVGASKLLFGRTKPHSGFDLFFTDSGLSYPSGHAANAVLTWGIFAYLIYRYSHNTHWFSDLLAGLFIGASLLVAIIAVDRSITSDRQPS